MGCGASSNGSLAVEPTGSQQGAVSHTYKLTYFDFPARAEPIKFLFAAAGAKYEFNGIKQEDWPALKPMAITGALPILEVDGRPLGQSMAIGRFVARELGLTGADSFDAAVCDMITDTTNEIFFGKVVAILYGGLSEEEQAAAIDKYIEEFLPPQMAILQKLADKNSNGYFVGKSLTWADIYFFSVFDQMSLNLPADKYDTIKEKFVLKSESFTKILETVKSNPGIAKYLESRSPPVVNA